MFRPAIHFDSVTSTMDVLSVLASDGAPSGTTVAADFQTGGRGRSGRTWTAPPATAVLMSTLLRPPRSIAACGVFALLTGLAVARALDAGIESRCRIKWPNDVLIEGRKVAGILIAAREGSTPQCSTLIVGIGINVTTEAAALPSGATSLQQHATRSVTKAEIFDRLAVTFETVYTCFCTGAIDDALVEVDDRLAFRGQEVVVRDGPREVRGWVRGVDRHGALVLEQNGRSVVIRSGELTWGPRPVER